MKRCLSLLFIFIVICAQATNYYVSPTGNNFNNGLFTSTAFQTINHAASLTMPGDTVFIMNGVYTNENPSSNVVDIYNSGTEDNAIVYMNYPSHNPVIKLFGNNWSGIVIQGADYITIDGISIMGNNDSITFNYAQSEQNNLNNPATSGNGIGITMEYNNDLNLSHHNIIRNCRISKCGGGGIYTYRADYTTIENNSISECAWYSLYGNSGISLYQNWNSDSSNEVKNFIVGNTCYRNEEYIPFFAVGSITDGNGIIIDDGRNTQNNSTLGVYLGKTYVANNLVFDNGGRGIHCYSSDNVIIVNNTCFQNCQSPEVQDGEYTAFSADSIWFINNISSPSAGIPPFYRSNSTATNVTVDHNLWANNAGLANPFGTNTITGSPDFILPSPNALLADFHLSTNSIAINAGTHFMAPAIDKDGIERMASDSVDIGCYEWALASNLFSLNKEPYSLQIFPNPAESNLFIQGLSANVTQIEIYNSTFERMMTTKRLSIDKGMVSLDVSPLEEGVYFLLIRSGDHVSEVLRFVKSK